MSFPVIIDLARVRARRGDYLGALRSDRRGKGHVTPPRPPQPVRFYEPHDRVVERASGRRGIVQSVAGPDKYVVMFYQGRKDQPWHASRWGYELAPDPLTPIGSDQSTHPKPAA